MQLPTIPAENQTTDNAAFIIGLVSVFIVCSSIYYQIKKIMLVYGAADNLESIQRQLNEMERKLDYIMRNMNKKI